MPLSAINVMGDLTTQNFPDVPFQQPIRIRISGTHLHLFLAKLSNYRPIQTLHTSMFILEAAKYTRSTVSEVEFGWYPPVIL